MSFTTFSKDVDAVLDYTRDWGPWLAQSGDDSIVASAWIVADGITMVSDSNTESTATIWLSGGTVGKRYQITNRITTNGGRTDDRTFVVKVTEL